MAVWGWWWWATAGTAPFHGGDASTRPAHIHTHTFAHPRTPSYLHKLPLTRATQPSRTTQAKFFEDEVRPDLKHTKPGLLCMASGGENMNTSQFYITMRGEDLEFLDGKHTIFGEVAEGLDGVLKDINELYCDTNGRPYR